MKEQLQMLWELQALDQQKKSVGQRKDCVSSDEVRALWQQLQQVSGLRGADRQRLEAVQKECMQQEKELNGLTEQLKTMEKRLYSGELTHVKEMEQLKAKCENFRQEVGSLETILLSNMETSETLGSTIALQEKQIEETKRAHAKKQQDMAACIRQAEQEISELEAEAQDLAARIDPQVFAVFQRLKTKYSAPVAKLENGICSGCRMSIPTSQTVSSAVAIQYCDNCGRMLL